MEDYSMVSLSDTNLLAAFSGVQRSQFYENRGSTGKSRWWAFMEAGFEAIDVHMSDVPIISGQVTLFESRGLAACGGSSYGDVLGVGKRWGIFGIVERSRPSQIFSVLSTE
jgi:hypothetical protein